MDFLLLCIAPRELIIHKMTYYHLSSVGDVTIDSLRVIMLFIAHIRGKGDG